MKRVSLGSALAASVAAVGVLNALAAISMPVAERRVPVLLIAAWLGLLSLHAATYALGIRIRDRLGLRTYAVAQGATLFAIALARVPAPLTILLYLAAIAELITLAKPPWNTVRITLGAVAVLVVASLITSGLYRATTDGLILAATGLVVHAVAGLLGRRAADEPGPAPVAGANGAPALSAREAEVLRELVRGARNSDIAATLRISERTVKAHLGQIYQKLGVTSRTAAVATAMQLDQRHGQS